MKRSRKVSSSPDMENIENEQPPKCVQTAQLGCYRANRYQIHYSNQKLKI